MRSTTEWYSRKGMGIVLAAVAAFALAMPAAAQSQGEAKNKAQGQASTVDQMKEKTKDKAQEKTKSIYPAKVGDFDWNADLDKATAAMSKAYVAADLDTAKIYSELAKEQSTIAQFKYDSGYNTAFPQYGAKLAELGATLAGFQDDGKDREREIARARGDRESALYSQGSAAIDQGKWQAAVDRFDQVVEMKGKKADAALFWKAWAQNKLGQRNEALLTLTAMQKDYPQSRWLDDAKKLELEVKQASGRPVSPDDGDCELKLLALNGLQQADPVKAVPLLEKMIHSADCAKIRGQAFFVLAQSNSPEAKASITKMARGEGVNPLVQERAIQALGLYRSDSGREILGQIYSSTNDTDVKRTILRSLMQSNDRARVLAAAKSEKDAELRAEAIRLLGQMGARDDIWQLYQSESSVDVKKVILQSLWQSGDIEHVSQLAMNEKDPSLRMSAINDLGLMDRRNNSKSEDTLLAIYAADSNPDVKKKVINALFISNDAKALVTLAKKETDPTMKKTIVSELANMHSPDATAYLLELLNK